MLLKKTVYSIFFIILISILYLGCTPSSSALRYNDFSGVKTHEDSVRVGLIKDDTANLLYYSQVQDTSFEYQMLEDEEDNPVDESPVDISTLLDRIRSSIDDNDSSISNNTPKERMLMEIIKYIDTPYKYGGNSQLGIDCSAFTQNVFRNSLDLTLYRSAREQFKQGTPIQNRDELTFGDLVFFNTRRAVRPGHVGIYIGENLFAHASSSKGVIISSMDHNYYSRRFMGARRIDDIFTRR
jgi:hypothetical protein